MANNPTMPAHQSIPLYAQRNNNNARIVLSEQQQVNVRKKLDQLRQQFYSEFLNDDKHGRIKGGQLKRSMTERIGTRAMRDRSLDSGLSSPGSQVSGDSEFIDTGNLHRSRSSRYMSFDRSSLKCSLNKSVNDLQSEAQYLASMVSDLSSTKTMRKRRTEVSSLSISARRQRSMERLGSYAPIAPGESVWGHKFDELMARLRGCEVDSKCEETSNYENTKSKSHGTLLEASPEESRPVKTVRMVEEDFVDSSNIDDSGISDSNVSKDSDDNDLKTEGDNSTKSAIQSDSQSIEKDDACCKEVVVENVQQTYSAVQQTEHQPIESVVTSPKPVTAKIGRSMTEDLRKTQSKPTELKSILRSISFHRPDIATYNMPLGNLRRTDSNNDVWVEKDEEIPQHQQSTPALSNKTQNPKSSSTWKRLSRVFSFKKNKSNTAAPSKVASKPKLS